MNIDFKNIKVVLACLCAASAMNGFSQQYFRATANGGISTINYSADDITTKMFDKSSIGGGVAAEYIMLFNQHVGASAGVGVSMSQSKYLLDGTLSESMPYYIAETEEEKSFVYEAKFENWEEKQMIHTIDIPVGAIGKISFSDNITAMAGAGVKFQIPIKATYKVSDDAVRTTSGYYSDFNAQLLPNGGVDHYGFYTFDKNHNDWKKYTDGELNTAAISVAAYLDLGVMHKIGGQSVYYGIYGQYGFTQVNAEPEREFLSQYGSYDSPLNTKMIEKSHLLSLGIKLGYVLPLTKETETVETVEE